MKNSHKQSPDEFQQALLNAVGHELNTPLTPILIHLKFLEARAKEMDPKMPDSFKIVERNLARLESRVRDIIDVSRLDSDRFPVRIKNEEFSTIIEEVVEDFTITGDIAGQTIELEQNHHGRVQVDRRRMVTVLANLLDNAIRFTPEGGTIKVKSRVERNWLIVEIEDTGVGFPPSEEDRLFKPFGHLDQPVPHAYQGAGLGLYVSKGIVELHGGTIWGKSEGRNRGATFGFRIPVSQSRLFPITFTTNTEREVEFSKRIQGLV